jgi:hypothetical protein
MMRQARQWSCRACLQKSLSIIWRSGVRQWVSLFCCLSKTPRYKSRRYIPMTFCSDQKTHVHIKVFTAHKGTPRRYRRLRHQIRYPQPRKLCSRHQPILTIGGAATSDISTVGKPAVTRPMQWTYARFAPHLRLPSAHLLIVCSSIAPDTKPVAHAEACLYQQFSQWVHQRVSSLCAQFLGPSTRCLQQTPARRWQRGGTQEQSRASRSLPSTMSQTYVAQQISSHATLTDGGGLATLRQGLCRQAEASGRRCGA